MAYFWRMIYNTILIEWRESKLRESESHSNPHTESLSSFFALPMPGSWDQSKRPYFDGIHDFELRLPHSSGVEVLSGLRRTTSRRGRPRRLGPLCLCVFGYWEWTVANEIKVDLELSLLWFRTWGKLNSYSAGESCLVVQRFGSGRLCYLLNSWRNKKLKNIILKMVFEISPIHGLA